MKISDLKNSRFLTKENCEPPIIATISHVDQANVAPADQKAEQRYVLHFKEELKPLVLNMVNGQTIAGITGSDDSDDWTNAKIVLYHEANVSFQGKLIGGIRIRPPAQEADAEAETASDIPW